MTALKREGLQVLVGPSWTTDAPFRETAEAIEAARAKGVLAVEMEAAALYTFARTRARRCCVWPMSPTPWVRPNAISRKANPTGQPMR